MSHQKSLMSEWPTLALLCFAYALWGLSIQAGASAYIALGIIGVALSSALHSSLCHEVLHGHPTRNPYLNGLLVFPQLSLSVPYLRFKDTHLAHHMDENLTDPYDDPESNFMDPSIWATLAPWQQRLLRMNNTLLGRMVLGPALGHIVFYRSDLRAMARGDLRIWQSYALHALSLALMIWIIGRYASLPIWAILLGTYLGHSLLKIRTFLEHRAHAQARARTVIIEDRGPLAWLFLNNNLHVVHHMHPRVAWYDLWALYQSRREHYRRRNEAYVYQNYGQIFAQYLLRAKDPVPHPLMSNDPIVVSDGLSDPLCPQRATAQHPAGSPIAHARAHPE